MCIAGVPLPYRPTVASDAAQAASAVRGKNPQGAFAAAPEPLPVPVYDNHTHFDFGDSPVELGAALDAAAAVGVAGAVQVGCDLDSSRFSVAAVDADPRLLGAVAIHPNEAPVLAKAGELDAALQEIAGLAAHPRVRAIGETGLDYFRTGDDGRAAQHESFRRHLDIAKSLDLALQIHCRDAQEDVLKILADCGAPERLVFHCFSGDEDLAQICNDRGWYMSFSGTFTFKNAHNLRRALAVADPALILCETDAPFLTPHPFRGRPNASYMLPYTVRSMAETTGQEVTQLCTRLNANTEAVYGSWSD